MSKVYVGDKGTEIILDCGSDVSAATVRKIKAKKPDGTTVLETLSGGRVLNTLSNTTLNSVANLKIVGLATIPLAATTLTAAASLKIVSTATASLNNVTFTSTGSLRINSTSNIVLAGISSEIYGQNQLSHALLKIIKSNSSITRNKVCYSLIKPVIFNTSSNQLVIIGHSTIGLEAR